MADNVKAFPGTKRPEPVSTEPDMNLVAFLKDRLSAALSGEMQGLLIVWGNEDGAIYHNHHLTDDFDAHRAIGAITVLGHSMAAAMVGD